MSNHLTLGSLFDGVGGFPLAGLKAGIQPVWASEIEPFPIRVTTKRIPEMKHLGDICQIHGGEIEPVDIVTFGFPCVSVSVAGSRQGLHGKGTSLFFEAVRVIHEMREATHGKKPRYAVFENVPGLLSSGKAGDYRQVLENLVRIKDPEANVPMPERGKWLSAGEILGDNYSLAWRILDASKGFGVAQRRRRIFAVLDLDGQCSGSVLFESEGLSGYSPPRGSSEQGAAGATFPGADKPSPSRDAIGFEPGLLRRKGDHHWREVCSTLRADMGDNQAAVAYGIGSDQSKGMLSANPHAGIYEADTSRTLDCSGGNPSAHQGGMAIVEPAPSYCMTVGSFSQVCKEESTTLEARGYKDPPVVGRPYTQRQYIVRRLTPDEAAVLQGFPSDWCHGLETDSPTDAEIAWWQQVFEAYRMALGKNTKPRTANQVRKWLQKPNTDGAEYKAFGNSVAIPCVHFVLAGIVWAHNQCDEKLS